MSVWVLGQMVLVLHAYLKYLCSSLLFAGIRFGVACVLVVLV